MKKHFQKIFHITTLLLLLGQGASQVFCGDVDCLEGGSSENCTTLLCSILGSHTNAPSQSSDKDQGCHCVCHLQFNHADIDLFDLQLTSVDQVALEPIICTTFFPHRIDHPPTA